MRKINKIQIPSGESAEIHDARIPTMTYKKGRLLKVNEEGTGFDFTTLKTINGVPLYGFGDIKLSIDNGNIVTSVVDEVQGVDDYLCFEATVNANNPSKPTISTCCGVGFKNNGDNSPIIYYSYDKINWILWGNEEYIYLLYAGDKLYVRGENGINFSYSETKYTSFYFSSSDNYITKVSGNVMRLLGEDNDTTVGDYCFCRLFYRYTASTTRRFYTNGGIILPATNLGKGAYYGMFESNKYMTVAPELPATNLSENCYRRMFYELTNLTKTPNLPATTLTTSCYYQMFYKCTSLQEVTSLSFTSVALMSCYTMFYGCSNLTDVPPLLPTTLTNHCYYQMFYNCSSLQEVTTHHTDKMGTASSASNYRSTYQWLSGVASSGLLHCPEELVLDAGESGLPSGWERENI